MEGILAAFVMVTFFSLLAPIWKTLRNKGVSVRTVLAMSGFTVPAWILMAILFSYGNGIHISLLYLIVFFAWVVGVVIRNSISTYLFRYKALTEMGAYGLAFSALFAALSDIFVFQVVFEPKSIVAFVLLITGGLLISRNRKLFRSTDVSTTKTLLLIGTMAALAATFFSLYKIGMQLQTHFLLHVALSQAALHGILFIYGYKDLQKDVRRQKVRLRHLFLVTLFLTIGVFGEAYALAELPIVVVVLTAILPISFFTVFDIQKKEFTVTWKTMLAIFLIAAGIMLFSL